MHPHLIHDETRILKHPGPPIKWQKRKVVPNIAKIAGEWDATHLLRTTDLSGTWYF